MLSPITTHILDVARGRPAEGVAVTLEHHKDGQWQLLGQRQTDADGRVRDLLSENVKLSPGAFRLNFDTNSYFSKLGVESFYPSVTVTFSVKNPGEHFHVPLLLSPFGYSTYRGS